ncbi:MAG: acyltransferase [Desulforhopalus sp.]|nr:acyltransferase [Desulforhopalus sp.]
MNHKPIWNSGFSKIYFKKAIKFFLIHISKQFFIAPGLRSYLLAACGIKFYDRKSTFIGSDVLFDTTEGTTTTIGKNVVITNGSRIITHYPILSRTGIKEYRKGDVVIKDYAFIGMNTLIIKPVTIGLSAVVGAGSVVTKDVPDYSIVVGNPASVIATIDTTP